MKYLVTFILTLAIYETFGQGTINFNNRVVTWGVDAPISYAPGGPAPAGLIDGSTVISDGTYLWGGIYATAGLYAGPAGTMESDLYLLPPVVGFRSGAYAGYLQMYIGGSRFVAGVLPAAPAVFQIRAWDAGIPGVSSYEEAMAIAQTRAVYLGRSPMLDIAALGGVGSPPSPPPSLVGLQGFSLSLASSAVAPEPSTIVFGVVCAFTAFYWRRKTRGY